MNDISVIIICLLAMYAISFTIKEVDGPWGIIGFIRNKLMQNKYVGVFFYKLLNCYFCVGFHSGWIVYLLAHDIWKVNFIILWALAGAAISLIIDRTLMRD
jgi:hypothetical protein